ncbi:hypothetical protein LTR72_003375 [Exophiala xenobiotica]|nr:hypothetical protein LTR72_003375 [Exophiala xenobiotica]KAK5301133.1 hypothetical protein LTR14_001531 [Exophiala xenobiotica]
MAEEFSYFTLLNKGAGDAEPGSSLFGISCTRQIRADKLKRRSADVTRSTVQKAVVVVSSTAQGMGELRERLGAVTAAWYHQDGGGWEAWTSEGLDEGSARFVQSQCHRIEFLQVAPESHPSSTNLKPVCPEGVHVSAVPEDGETIAWRQSFHAQSLKYYRILFDVLSTPGAVLLRRHRFCRDFSDTTILKDFQESLARLPAVHEGGKDHYFGLSIREMIYEFRHQTLALVKCLLLQRKMLFFGSKCERLCMMQFALVSLIPGLIKNLQDAADPALDSYAQHATRAATLRTSDRSSLLSYMGLPLQIFGKGSFFGPYTPLQQLDILADYDTKSYVVGSTNSLLLQQKEKYSDILINLDESNSITITSPSLRTALTPSAADRRWIDFLTQTVLDTWDPENPSRPKNMGYAGSEDAIRLQFEEYILSLLSSMAYQVYHESMQGEAGLPSSLTNTEHYPDPGDTATDFNPEFLAIWRSTHNFELFDNLTRGNRIFDIIEPRHPTGGGLSVEDVQRRLQQNLAELHLDERMREGREQLGKTIAVGKERVARFWAEVEQRRKVAQSRSGNQAAGSSSVDQARKENESLEKEKVQQGEQSESEDGAAMAAGAGGAGGWASSIRDRAAKVQLQRPNVDTAQLQASARENAAKAGAYLSSWGSWAKDRMQQGKGPAGQTTSSSPSMPTSASAAEKTGAAGPGTGSSS